MHSQTQDCMWTGATEDRNSGGVNLLVPAGCRRPPPGLSAAVNPVSVLSGPTCSFLKLQVMGEGCYGKVVECLKLDTMTPVAVKTLKQRPCIRETKHECEMLQKICLLDPDKYNLVKFYFTCNTETCMVFEKLDKSLYQLMTENYMLTLSEIRPIIKQLLVAFEGLKSIGMIHTDLKPDNVMLVNHQQEPFRIKLIDFGLAIPVSKVKPGQIIQPTSLRAPEVILGLPVTEAIDMWSLGSLMAYLFTGTALYPASSEYDALTFITHMQGELSNDMLDKGLWTKCFFKQRTDCFPCRWELKTPEEYLRDTGMKHMDNREFCFDDLSELIELYAEEEGSERQHMFQYLDLLKKLLHLDPTERITPSEALEHPFITMCYLDKYHGRYNHVQMSLQGTFVWEMDEYPDDAACGADYSPEDISDGDSPSTRTVTKDRAADSSCQLPDINSATDKSQCTALHAYIPDSTDSTSGPLTVTDSVGNLATAFSPGEVIPPKPTATDGNTSAVHLLVPPGCHRRLPGLQAPVNIQHIQETGGISADRDNQALQESPAPLFSSHTCSLLQKITEKGCFFKVMVYPKLDMSIPPIIKCFKQWPSNLTDDKQELKNLLKIYIANTAQPSYRGFSDRIFQIKSRNMHAGNTSGKFFDRLYRFLMSAGLFLG